MNPKGGDSGERGNGVRATSGNKPDTPSSETITTKNDRMKRAAAKQLIERYYYQLTEGCGEPECDNNQCSSCPAFCYPTMSRNEAALRAIELFKNKSQLCDLSKPSKMSKGTQASQSPSQHQQMEEGASSSTPMPTTSSASTMSPIVGSDRPSTSSASASSTSPTKQIVTTPPPVAQAPYLTEEKINGIIKYCQEEDNWSYLIRTIGSTFNNPEALVQSFRLDLNESPTKEEIRSMEIDMDKDTDEKAERLAGEVAGSSASTSGGIMESTSKGRLKSDEVSVDLDCVRRSYTELFAIPGHPFQGALINALVYLSRTLEMDLRYHNAYHHNPNYLNIFLIVMEIPTLHSPEFIKSATPLFCKALGRLPVKAQAKLARVWSKFPTERLKGFVECLQQLITVKVVSGDWNSRHGVNEDEAITNAARVMKILYYASMLGGTMDTPCCASTASSIVIVEDTRIKASDDNLQDLLQGAVGHEPKEKPPPKLEPLEKELGVNQLDCLEPLVAWEEFVNEPLSEQLEMDRDYTNYKAVCQANGEDVFVTICNLMGRVIANEANDVEKFSFMTHSFLLTTAVKNLGMYFDNRIRMMEERRASLLQSLMHGAPTMPYLRLRIRRDHIIDDALVALEMTAVDNPQDLKKQLYVEFEGEQGIDEGGVSKEFFQLVVEEMFNPDIGMFVHEAETHNFLFCPTSFENDGQFMLIGIVLGLAIYNNVILDIHFPMVVYRKLIGKKGNFHDLKQSHPTLANSLQHLLDFEGDVKETFMQTFVIGSTDVFSSAVTNELRPGGDDIFVTNENRQEFVNLYVDYLMNKSIEKQFRAFKRGFQLVTDESPLKMLFRPEEIELLICGSKHFDFRALEEATDYDGGFTSDSPTVKYFWEVVHELSEDQKRQLLQFTTGSDRVPVGGLSKLKLIVARNGPDSDRLPTSHTCFNVLLLPDYTTKEKLKERLLKAITHAKGFGML